jgi:uncharacterized protein YlxW (UPF0749 family)
VQLRPPPSNPSLSGPPDEEQTTPEPPAVLEHRSYRPSVQQSGVRKRVIRAAAARKPVTADPEPELEPGEPMPVTAESEPELEPGEPMPVTAESEPEPEPATPEPALGGRSRRRTGSIGVALVLVAAGLLFTTSATTSHGGQLRSQQDNLADLIQTDNKQVQQRTKQVTALRNAVQQEAAANAVNDKAIQALEKRSANVVEAAGLLPVTGPGLRVTLDDAPQDASVPADAGPDDLVVHQQDVQAVVNALWAGGAEAMMLQDQRVISTSAIRCVGNTLILQGQVYSPPYSITAIGDPRKLQKALNSSPEIDYYLEYVAALRLGWSVKSSPDWHFPAYAGSLALTHARVADSTNDGGTSSPTPS